MADEQLLAFIAQNKRQGRSEDVIRELSIQTGWTPDKIDEAFQSLNNSQPVQEDVPAQPTISTKSESFSNQPASTILQNPSRLNVFSYQGRIGRLRYFLGSLAIAAFAIIIAFVVYIYGVVFLVSHSQSPPSAFGILAGFGAPLFLAVLIPYVLASSFVVRRFHDLDKSGLWYFALLIPFYDIYLALELLTQRGTVGANQYGEDPLAADAGPTDPVHRLVGGSPVVKIILAAAILIILAVADVLHPQPTEQQSFGNAINQALSQQENLHSAVPSSTEKQTSSTVPASTPAVYSPVAHAATSTFGISGATATSSNQSVWASIGQTHAEDVANENAALNEGASVTGATDLVIYDMEYDYAFGQRLASQPQFVQRYYLYSAANHARYYIQEIVADFNGGYSQSSWQYVPSFGQTNFEPASPCITSGWNISSAQAIDSFLADGGNTFLMNATKENAGGQLSVSISCEEAPDDFPEWTVLADLQTPNTAVFQKSYNATTGRGVSQQK